MSDLQIALGAIGILVVGGVYAFNWWQERRLRQRLERAFDTRRDDVLLNKTATRADESGARVEPRLGAGAEPAAEPVAGSAITGDEAADTALEFVAEIDAPDPVPAAALHELQSAIAVFGKPSRVLLWDAAAGGWRAAGRGSVPEGCTRLLAAIQLVNRNGPVHAPQLTGFRDAVQSWAQRHEATAATAEPAVALRTAQALDALCGEVDVAIGINVVAPEGAAFSGEQLAAAAEGAGFELAADGLFHWRNGDGDTLFTMENHDPEPFDMERLTALQTPGVTLLLDVPRVPDGEAALDEMARVAGDLAESLGGFMVDDNRVPLQAAGIARIKAQLVSIRKAMAEHDIPAGSLRAQRLFA